MGKKLGWCERILAIAQNRLGFEIKSCQKDHGVDHCADCLDYPWPQEEAVSPDWPKG